MSDETIKVNLEDLKTLLRTAGDSTCEHNTSSVYDRSGECSTWFDYYYVADKNLWKAIKDQKDKLETQERTLMRIPVTVEALDLLRAVDYIERNLPTDQNLPIYQLEILQKSIESLKVILSDVGMSEFSYEDDESSK